MKFEIGDEVYADKTSIIGGIGVQGTLTDVSEMIKKFNIEYDKHSTNKFLQNDY